MTAIAPLLNRPLSRRALCGASAGIASLGAAVINPAAASAPNPKGPMNLARGKMVAFEISVDGRSWEGEVKVGATVTCQNGASCSDEGRAELVIQAEPSSAGISFTATVRRQDPKDTTSMDVWTRRMELAARDSLTDFPFSDAPGAPLMSVQAPNATPAFWRNAPGWTSTAKRPQNGWIEEVQAGA